MTAIDVAMMLHAKGWAPIPVEYKGKRPTTKNWPSLRITRENVAQYFNGKEQNVGSLLGDACGGRVDVDLDCAEAIAVAPTFLPSTLTFGRASRRCSHWLYACGSAPGARALFQDPIVASTDEKRAMLVELRANECQTVFPGSVHETGEHIEWDDAGVAMFETTRAELEQRVRRVAAAALLARYWSSLSRNETVLNLAGALANSGWSEQDALAFVRAVCLTARDEELESRERRLRDTFTKHASKQRVKGLSGLVQHLDQRIIDKLADWLDLRRLEPVFDYDQAERAADAPFAVDEQTTTAPSRRPLAPADVVAQWSSDGPLVRVPTGIRPLDEACRGGLPIPWRVIIIGAPSAGKTATEMVIADAIARVAAADGLCVGILGVDEEPEDLTVRLIQIAGFTVAQAELRAPEDLERMREALGPLRLRLYDSAWTIDAAAEDLASWAKSESRQAAFFVDSIQAARSAGAKASDGTPRLVVEANIVALRVASTSHRMLVVGTSEANRESYRSDDAATKSNDLAAGAESRAIEFGAQTLLMLRTPKDHADVVHVRVAKNRRAHKAEFWLRLDRERHVLTECSNPESDPDEIQHREGEKRQRNRLAVEADAVALAAVARLHPGMGERALRAALKVAGHKWGVERLDAAKDRLGRGVRGERLVNRGDGKAARYHLEQAIPQEGT